MTKRQVTRWAKMALIYLVLLIALLFAVIPIIYILMSSFKVGNSLYSSTLIPRQFTFKHYLSLFTDPRYPFLQWTKNTLKVSTMTATATVVLTTMCAYAFSRFRFWGRKYGLMAFMVIQMFPGAMSMVGHLRAFELGRACWTPTWGWRWFTLAAVCPLPRGS